MVSHSLCDARFVARATIADARFARPSPPHPKRTFVRTGERFMFSVLPMLDVQSQRIFEVRLVSGRPLLQFIRANAGGGPQAQCGGAARGGPVVIVDAVEEIGGNARSGVVSMERHTESHSWY